MAATLLAIALAACGGGDDDGTVTIRGDAPGLDTLGFRADSLLGLVDRSALVLDSMKAAMRAELDRAAMEPLGAPVSASGDGTLALPGDAASAANAATDAASAIDAERDARRATIAASALSAGREMSERARERGDSMARANAQRLAGDASRDRMRTDTLRGVLAFQGEAPARAVVLQVGGTTVALSGMATTGLSRLVGTEVVVRGMTTSPRDIVVADYIVRAANGAPAYDGTLLDDGQLRLTDGSGVLRVPVPPALQGLQGARVWIAVKNGAATSYGLVGRR
jgi:hypothetical protein